MSFFFCFYICSCDKGFNGFYWKNFQSKIEGVYWEQIDTEGNSVFWGDRANAIFGRLLLRWTMETERTLVRQLLHRKCHCHQSQQKVFKCSGAIWLLHVFTFAISITLENLISTRYNPIGLHADERKTTYWLHHIFVHCLWDRKS